MKNVREIFETMEYGPAPESTEIALDWLDSHRRTFSPFINGEFPRFIDECYFESIDPQSGQALARIVQCGEMEINAAVEAANSAFPKWSALSGYQRANYLRAIAGETRRHARLLAVLESLDSGRPVHEPRETDLALVERHFCYHAGWAHLRVETFIGYEPVGICAQIVPSALPLLALAWKIAPALAAGNTIVIKPAAATSLTALLFAEILQQIQLPPGVVNIVTGDEATETLLFKHRDIQKISFTGSAEIGKQIRFDTAGSGKLLSLTLGARSPFIVLDDADLDSAIERIVHSIWSGYGKAGCAGNRLLLQENIYEKVIGDLRHRLEKLWTGDPREKSAETGVMFSREQLKQIQHVVELGKADGATFWQPSWASSQEDFYYPPILFSDVEPSSPLAQIEMPATMLLASSFRRPGDAIELANNTDFGLSAAIWTENIGLALEIAPQLKVGTIWINSANLFDAASGFGGYRESGFGREGGNEGMYEYLLPSWERSLPHFGRHEAEIHARPVASTTRNPRSDELGIRRAELYIGGKFVRPESGCSFAVKDTEGRFVAEAGFGSRKDIRMAVEAARNAPDWPRVSAYKRGQTLARIAENLAVRASEFSSSLQILTGVGESEAKREVAKTVERLFYYAAWADKYDGHIHQTLYKNVSLAMPEPWGIMGLICPGEYPLLWLVTLLAPALATGNRVVAVPSARFPIPPTDFCQLLDAGDLPPGVVNVVTGHSDELAKVLAQHSDVGSVWYIGSAKGSATVERESRGNLKATWVNHGRRRNVFEDYQAQGWEYLRHAVQIKNIWLPYG